MLDQQRTEAAEQQRDADNARTNLVIRGPIVAFTLVSAVNTFATATSQGTPELAGLGTAIAMATLTAFGRGAEIRRHSTADITTVVSWREA